MLLLNNETGGYPSLAIREFLNLLSEHRAMRDVPMFSFADHDVYGFDIYHVLNFGSRATPWASPTLICPRLRWAGSTTDALFASVKAYASTSTVAPQWEANMMTKLRNRMKKKTLTAEGQVRYQNMLRSGVLEMSGEEDVRQEVWNMVRQKQVSSAFQSKDEAENSQQFSFLDFTLVQSQGAEMFPLQRLEELVPQLANNRIANVEPAISQCWTYWKNTI